MRVELYKTAGGEIEVEQPAEKGWMKMRAVLGHALLLPSVRDLFRYL